MIVIREAERTELDWINQRYDEVKFIHSHWENEKIAIASCQGNRAGLGRLVTLDKLHLELGGIVVFEEFRGRGIAGKIVEYLMQQASSSMKIFCIPFAPLVPFYERFGFAACSDWAAVPESILQKCHWCGETYAVQTKLFVYEGS